MISRIKFHLLSRNRNIYREIAQEYGTSPIRVYQLAHGRRGKNDKDYFIIKRLKEKGLIVGTYR